MNIQLKKFKPEEIHFFIPGKNCIQNRSNKGTFLVDGEKKVHLKLPKESPQETLFALALVFASHYEIDSIFNGLEYLAGVLSVDEDFEGNRVEGNLKDFMKKVEITKSFKFVAQGEINSVSDEWGGVSYKLPKTAKESFPVYAAVFCLSYFGPKNVKSIVGEAIKTLRA